MARGQLRVNLRFGDRPKAETGILITLILTLLPAASPTAYTYSGV